MSDFFLEITDEKITVNGSNSSSHNNPRVLGKYEIRTIASNFIPYFFAFNQNLIWGIDLMHLFLSKSLLCGDKSSTSPLSLVICVKYFSLQYEVTNWHPRRSRLFGTASQQRPLWAVTGTAVKRLRSGRTGTNTERYLDNTSFKVGYTNN